MFRVRLASGEEAVYRSVDELALGIQSGMITATAEIFHAKTDRWLPIASHPEYILAVERAATPVAIAELPATAALAPMPDGVPQVYQMFSRSARELADRRRPRRWQARLVGSIAGLVLVAATALTLLPDPQATDEAVLPPGAIRESLRSPGTRQSDLSEQEDHVRHAPYNLANRFARAKEAAATAMSDSAAQLKLVGALSPPRLASSDSLRRILDGLTALGPLIHDYRVELRRLQRAYRDTAEGLARGEWTRSDAQEWRARIFLPEHAAGAGRADTLLATLTRLYAFLLAEPNRINLATGQFVAGSDTGAATYDRLRRELTRLRNLSPEMQTRAGPPLRTLLALLGSDTLPARSSS